MADAPKQGGIFGLIPLAFRELRLAFASRATLLRESGIDPETGAASLPGVRTDAESLREYVRVRRLVAWLLAGFGVFAPLLLVAVLAVFVWWPDTHGDPVAFGVHLGLGGSLLYVVACVFGMLAASMLVRGVTKDLQARRRAELDKRKR